MNALASVTLVIMQVIHLVGFTVGLAIGDDTMFNVHIIAFSAYNAVGLLWLMLGGDRKGVDKNN